MSDPMDDLERADSILKGALDAARTIAGNPGAGDKPRQVAEALIEAEPLVESALEGLGDGPEGPEGDWTVLPDGDHALKQLEGNYRAATPLGARITVPCELMADSVADGLVFVKGVKARERAVLAGCRVTAKGDDVEVALHLAGKGSFAQWCEVTDYAHRGVWVGGEGAWIADSWIHGQREGAESITDTTSSLMFGGTNATQPEAQRPMGWRAERVLVEDVVWRSTLEVKGCGATVEDCTVLGGAKVADAYVRHGFGNVFRQLWVENGGIQLGDRDNRADGCRAENGIAFKKGGVSGDEMRNGATGYPYAQDCVITDTESDIITDWANGQGEDWAHMPVGSKVAGVDEDQLQGKGKVEVDEGQSIEPPLGPPRKLTRDEVGPLARPAA